MIILRTVIIQTMDPTAVPFRKLASLQVRIWNLSQINLAAIYQPCFLRVFHFQLELYLG